MEAARGAHRLACTEHLQKSTRCSLKAEDQALEIGVEMSLVDVRYWCCFPQNINTLSKNGDLCMM